MQEIIFGLLYGIYPYVCIMVFLLGCTYRIVLRPYSITAKSSQFLDKRKIILPFVGFHIGIIFVLIGHFVGFFSPRELLLLIGVSDKIHADIAHISGGIFGGIAFVCMLLLGKRVSQNDRLQATRSIADVLVFLIIFIQLTLGLFTITPLNDILPPEERVVLLGYYFQGIVMLDFSSYKYVMQMPYLTLIHIFLGFSIFILVPFTRLIHAVFMPLHYLVRTGYQIIRK